MRYTAALAAAFVAGAAASVAPEAPVAYSSEVVHEPSYETDMVVAEHDEYDCDGDYCDEDSHDDCDGDDCDDSHDDCDGDDCDDDSTDDDCHDDDSYDCKSSSMVYDTTSVHPEPTETHYTTDVVSYYETYCPEPTEVTYNEITYTVTKATTLTIVDCPCTVTRPVITSYITDCPEHECPIDTTTSVDTIKATDTVVVVPVFTDKPVETHVPVDTDEPVKPTETHVAVDTDEPVKPVETHVPTDTVVVEPVGPVDTAAPFPVSNATVPVTPVGTGAATPTASVFEGAGSKAMTISGAGLAAVFAAVAYVL